MTESEITKECCKQEPCVTPPCPDLQAIQAAQAASAQEVFTFPGGPEQQFKVLDRVFARLNKSPLSVEDCVELRQMVAYVANSIKATNQKGN